MRSGLASEGGVSERKTSIDCVFLNPKDYAWTSTAMRSSLPLTAQYYWHFYLICVYICVVIVLIFSFVKVTHIDSLESKRKGL